VAGWSRLSRGSGPIRPADALLAAVEFVDADADPAVPTVQAVADWLAEQRLGQVTLVTPQPQRDLSAAAGSVCERAWSAAAGIARGTVCSAVSQRFLSHNTSPVITPQLVAEKWLRGGHFA
jgi:hypothetical protein